MKSSKSSSQSSVPPGIVLQKSPITLFSQVKIQKAVGLQSYPKISKINFWKVPRVLFRFLPHPPGIVLQKCHITLFNQVIIQKAVGLQSYPKILKNKFWKVTIVLVRVLFPTLNISTKKPHNIFHLSQNPKSCGTS